MRLQKLKKLSTMGALVVSSITLFNCTSETIDDSLETSSTENKNELLPPPPNGGGGGQEEEEEEEEETTSIDVDPTLFLEDGLVTEITTDTRTLSNGSSALCYVITTYSVPTDHEMGPWCPTNIDDDASQGGIWLEDGEVYDVDGAFIENMSSFYGDNTWNMYDDNGDIYVTNSYEDCENAANPNVGEEYENFCVECLPSYVTEITNTYVIPVTPVKLDTPNTSISSRGVAFNGVVFDAPAPTDAILGAYTLAPFDDAGGHINVNAGYHYHTSTGMSQTIEQDDDHAAMIGYAMDGYGMYEQLDADSNEPTDLDDCRGHEDDTRGYHYHVTAPGSNSFIDCFSGAQAEG